MNELKKGALPLDHKIPADQTSPPAPAPNGAQPPVTIEKLKEEAQQEMVKLLDHIRAHIDAGNVTGIGLVFLDKNAVPQHAFCLMPFMQMPIAMGMVMAADAAKGFAQTEIARYHARTYLPKQVTEPTS